METVFTRWSNDGRTMTLMLVVKFEHAGEIWTAPEGLRFDGASIPRLFWRLVGSPFCGRYRRAAVLHDAYYSRPRGKTRRQVDQMFRAAMRSDGVSRWRSFVMYWAVRVGGRFAWRRKEPRDV